MANPLLLDIAIFLKDNAIVQGDGIDTFRDFMPEAPDNIVVLNEYKGDPPVHYESSVNRSVQIVVRNVDADAARVLALSIFELLTTSDKVVHFTTSRWGQVHLRQTPFKIMQDALNRVSYGFNMGVTTTKD